MKAEKAGKEKCFVDRFFNFFHHLFLFPLSLVPIKHRANNCSDLVHLHAESSGSLSVVLPP